MSYSLPAQEFEFMLPRGLVTSDGGVHQQGRMRLSNARDEMRLQRDRQAQDNPVYGDLVMLSQVITQLGSLNPITPEVLENLFTLDLAYLREFYNQINQQGHAHVAAQCPQCQHAFQVELALSGEF